MNAPTHNPTPWTDEDIATLVTMRRAGFSIRAIAQALHRTAKATQTKCDKLKVTSGYKAKPPPRPKTSNRRRYDHQPPRAGKVTLPPLASLDGSHTV